MKLHVFGENGEEFVMTLPPHFFSQDQDIQNIIQGQAYSTPYATVMLLQDEELKNTILVNLKTGELADTPVVDTSQINLYHIHRYPLSN